MNFPKGETRQELLNRAFLYILLISISVLIFLRVKSLIFDLFVAVVLAALAEPVVYRLSKKVGRKLAALISLSVISLSRRRSTWTCSMMIQCMVPQSGDL